MITSKLYLFVVLIGLFLLMVACSDESVKTTPATTAPTATPIPPTTTLTPKQENKLVAEFGCQWIMDTYRPMTTLGRDMAVMNLATEMSLKRGGLSHIGSGDAVAALRECEAKGTNVQTSPPVTTELAAEFGCQWIVDTYRPMTMLGRDMAVMNLATEMSLKRGGLSHIGSADAAAALRECEAKGFK